MGNPLCYRDASTADTPEEVFARIDEAAHYAETGIQVMPINTMFQLYAGKKRMRLGCAKPAICCSCPICLPII